MTDVNPAIGSGFNVARGTFSGDSRPSSAASSVASNDIGSDHPFHNVDHHTMMAMKKALVVLQKVKGDNSVHQIADRLYLGSIGAALNLPELLSVGITHILCTATGVRSMHPDKFVYKTLTVLDSQSESLIDHFADSIYWLESALRENPSHKVLVHCFAGRSRSVAIILAYLMYKLRIPLSVALLHVRQFRASANPNIGFINQLKAFEQELFSSQRSFSYETLLEDLNSVVPGAKERLHTIKDGRVNATTSDRRASSAAYTSGASRLNMGGIRSRSSEILAQSRGDQSPVSDDCKPHKGPTRSALTRWLLVILFAIFVAGLEKASYPYYQRLLCDNWRPKMLQSVCDRVPSRKLEEEVMRFVHRTVHLFNSLTMYFPRL